MSEEIGLLFVHGVGEQQRFEHLTGTVRDFAELIRRADDSARCTVEDRTVDWPHPPGEPVIGSGAPVTLTVEGKDGLTRFECHEVWWADLGARTGVVDTIGFWIWGLGQWCAPIYRDLDAARLKTSARTGKGSGGQPGRDLNKQASKLVKLPESVAGDILKEPAARLRLLSASLATSFAVISWVLLKKLAAWLLGKATSPTILVSYVGDVRSYEQRATPGDTMLQDPGMPRRVGIRRRMVTEMVAMAARGYKRWYIVAHSQGSVVAYNALTEIGHALPNYLSEALWDDLPDGWRRDPGCRLREPDELASMMPARPPWLVYWDVLNRRKLFAGLRGFLTYGSPLNKFAAIWPRIVATATDRWTDGDSVFDRDCRWFNFRARQDPVAGKLEDYYCPNERLREKRPTFFGYIPTVETVTLPLRPNILIAHLRYFMPRDSWSKGLAVNQRHALMKWLLKPEAVDKIPSASGFLTPVISAFYYFATLVLLLGAGTLVCGLARKLAVEIFPRLAASLPGLPWPPNEEVLLVYALWLSGVALALNGACGYVRWASESLLNLRLALADAKSSGRVRAVNYFQMVAGPASFVIISLAIWAGSISAASLPLHMLAWGGGLCLVAIFVQTILNAIFLRALRYQ